MIQDITVIRASSSSLSPSHAWGSFERRHWGQVSDLLYGTPSLVSKLSSYCMLGPLQSNGFRSDHAFTAEFLLFYLDLWRAGMVSIFGMLKIFVDLFVISKMSPLVLTKGTMPAFPK